MIRYREWMNEKKKKSKVSVLYLTLLILSLASMISISIVTRSEGNFMLMGVPVSISLFSGVLSSFANMCIIVMVVYAGKYGFNTAIVLLLLQFPMNMMGMMMRQDLSTLPGICNNVLVLVVVILIWRRKNELQEYRDTEIDRAKARQKEAERLFEQTATALVIAIDAKDEYSRGHSLRVAKYSRDIAEHMGKSAEECREIYYAALLHDVGKIGVKDDILCKEGKLTAEEYEAIKKHPEYGERILSGISEYPYLSIGANNHHERYDGKGYPEKLKGNDIPEIARIISVADAYDAMSSNRSYREALPQQLVREEIVKGAGTQFDPEIAKIMQYLIDLDPDYRMKEKEEVKELSGRDEMICTTLRDEISEGILIGRGITKVHMRSVPTEGGKPGSHIPSFILFDSLDGRVHDEEKTIRDLNYFEFALIRFDGQYEIAGARKAETQIRDQKTADTAASGGAAGTEYTVELIRVKDHVLVKIHETSRLISVTVALPDCSRYVYAALTGENCHMKDVSIIHLDVPVGDDFIPRIAPMISYIEGNEGDIPNVQVDGYRTDTSKSIPVTDGLEITFHTMSLPTARLIWHCPYIVVFASDDGKVDGKGYREYALIRLDGENWESTEDDVKNELTVEKSAEFIGWDAWKEHNKNGFDCRISFARNDDCITVTTENHGIKIINVTYIGSGTEVLASLTGDQCALTDIRVRS